MKNINKMKEIKVGFITVLGLLLFTNLLTFLIFDAKTSFLTDKTSNSELVKVDGKTVVSDDVYDNWKGSANPAATLDVSLEEVDAFIVSEEMSKDPKAQEFVEEKMTQLLAGYENNGQDVKALLEESGIDYEEWLETMKINYFSEYYTKSYVAREVVTKDEVQAAISANPPKYRTSHILIKSSPDNGATFRTDEETKAIATNVLNELNAELAGVSDIEAKKEIFGKYTSKYSEDLDTKDKNGDIGFSNTETAQYDETAKGLNVGDVSGIIQTPYGYSIILKTDQQEAESIDNEETYKKYSQELASSKIEENAGYKKVSMFYLRDQYNIKFIDTELEKQYETSRQSAQEQLENPQPQPQYQ